MSVGRSGQGDVAFRLPRSGCDEAVDRRRMRREVETVGGNPLVGVGVGLAFAGVAEKRDDRAGGHLKFGIVLAHHVDERLHGVRQGGFWHVDRREAEAGVHPRERGPPSSTGRAGPGFVRACCGRESMHLRAL
jgi:hypothetical protein